MKLDRKIIFVSIIFSSILFQAFSYELSFKITPHIVFPFLSAGEEKYNPVGGGGFLNTSINLFGLLDVGPEFGFLALPKNNYSGLLEDEDEAVFFFPFGVQASCVFYPFSRVEASCGASLGGYIGYTDEVYHYAPWYKVYGEADYRINPNWSLGLNVSFLDLQNDSWFGDPGAAGLTAGLSVKFRFDTEKSLGSISGTLSQNESIFPLFYTIYKNNPFGTIHITNEETAEIHNVKVYFRAEGYTASDIECGSIKVIKKHRSEEIPVYADFASEILQFSEAGKIPGEIVVKYDLLGQHRTSVSQVIVPVYNRNQVRWTDPSALASYISSSSQEVLEFSKVLVGIARSHLRSGLNRNMQFAMYLYEGIRLSGIQCKDDADTPYNSTHKKMDALDYIQYPFQTMLYKSGDKDDVGVLFMALLESVGIEAAYIPLNNDFIVMLNLGVNASKAQNLFDGFDRVVVLDDEVWIPLSMSSLREGFVNSWYKAVVQIQREFEKDRDFSVVKLNEAWEYYPPAGFTQGQAIDLHPAESNLISSVETDISRYVTAEFGPQIAAVQNKIKTEGGSVTLYNQLGMLYVRAGMYSSAIPVYEISAKAGSVTAMNNLGNICSLQKRYKEAQRWYQMALSIEPANKSALKNLARIESELEK